MKKIKIIFGLCLITVFLLISCEEKGTLVEGGIIGDRGLWGEWIRLDNGNEWYITSNGIYINNSYSSTAYNFTRQSPNVVKVTSSTAEFYLYASRIPNRSFTANIEGDAVNRSARFTGLGNMDIIVSNLNDQANTVSARTKEDGSVEVENIIIGDEYIIQIGDSGTRVTPNNNGENIGTITVTNGINYKTTISSTSDMMRLYTGTSYNFTLRIQNTSEETARHTTYEIILPEGLTVTSGNLTGTLGSINPGQSFIISLSGVSCAPIDNEFEFKKIEVKLTYNEGGRTTVWNDSVSLKFNKDRVVFNLRSMGRMGVSGSVYGMIIVPNGRAYRFTATGTSTNQTVQSVTVPRISSEDYLIVFSGVTSTSNEAWFSFAVDSQPSMIATGELGPFYTQHQTEGTALQINYNDNIKGFLSENEIVYFRLRLPD